MTAEQAQPTSPKLRSRFCASLARPTLATHPRRASTRVRTTVDRIAECLSVEPVDAAVAHAGSLQRIPGSPIPHSNSHSGTAAP